MRPGEMNLDELVLRQGDRVETYGRLVSTGDGCWFEPPLPQTLMLGVSRVVSPPWHGAVPLVGANVDDVQDRAEHGSLVEGYATVVGRWSGDGIEVENQSASSPVPDPDPPRWFHPPCPPPEGGWPHGMPDGDPRVDASRVTESGAAVAVSMFRPSRTQAVVVVAASDVDAVERQLRPDLGASLCVVVSRFSRPQIDRIRQVLDRHWHDWDLYEVGESVDRHGQACVTARLARLVPEIVQHATQWPPGHVVLRPWLAPATVPGTGC